MMFLGFKETYEYNFNTTKTTLREFHVTACNGTEGCNDKLRTPTYSKTPPVDVNTIDYDIENIVDIDLWGDVVNNVSSVLSTPLFLIQSQYKTNGTERNITKKGRRKGKISIMSHGDKGKSTGNHETPNISHPVIFHDLSYKKPFRNRTKTSYLLVNLMNALKPAKLTIPGYTESKASNVILNDVISKYAVIKKRSINEQKLKHAPRSFRSVQKSLPSKRSDRNNRGSFKFFSHDSNEDGVDPVSSIFDQEFLFGGTKTGHESTTPFPIVDKDHDYNEEYDTEYDYAKANNLSEEDRRSEETDEEDKEETYDEYNEEPDSLNVKPKENSEIDVTVVKQEVNQDTNENKEEGQDEDEDDGMEVVREPPIIVLYKGGDSKQLQPSFEYALTNGGLDPRYLTKEPLAGPLATRGFNHNFQVIRGVPIQGNVVQPGGRYPTVGGFNTTQIHAIIQTGQLPTTTMPVNNNATIGVVPPAPADYVSYGRPVNMGQFLQHPHPGGSPYITRPQSPLFVRTHGGRGRRPPMRSPIRSQSAVVLTTGPRYVPYYRGSPIVRYRGNRNHMARYRPSNIGIPRGTRVAVMGRRASNGDAESPLTVH